MELNFESKEQIAVNKKERATTRRQEVVALRKEKEAALLEEFKNDKDPEESVRKFQEWLDSGKTDPRIADDIKNAGLSF